MRRLVAFAFILSAMCMVPRAHAQDAAAVTGVVCDANGAPVADADVLLVNTTTRASYSSRTNVLGTYRITNVTPGSGYKLTFRMPGFGQVVVNDIQVVVAATRTQNAVLKRGAVASEVQVSATTPR